MDCSEAGAMIDELALDVLPGDRRAALLAHLESCPGCRHLLDELSETADALLLAGPVMAPPEGFEDRVLERIQAPRVRPAARTVARSRGPARLRLLAAAAAAAVLLGVGGLAGAQLGRSSGDGLELETVRLIYATAADIGDVSTYGGESAWFFMRLDGALPNGTYRCVLDADDGHTVSVGRLWASSGHGAWGEHVSLDPRHVKTARLLDSTGATVATARLQ
ncbi:MAG TPA: zf-HC2 domain-containing protein [Acidimicrobiia bacterium]|nr:zf-HC2 domain-containing protein [Acidimicrobiia bacterium]